jgi:hypothetical protein
VLYSSRPDPLQVRTRCRNPRCAGKLKAPVSSPRDAFCCLNCEAAFYGVRCRVCESLFTPKTRRRTVCPRDKCRYAFKGHPERFLLRCERSGYPSGFFAHNAQESSTKSKLKTGTKSGRGWRIIAGPTDLHEINLRAHPADAAAWRTGRGPVLITRQSAPINIIGGYKFPGAPAIDLHPATEAPAAPAIPIGDESGISDFLKRTNDAARVPT